MKDKPFINELGEPNPQSPEVRRLLLAIRNRMANDLATHLPDEWLANSNSKNRVEFRKHILTSETLGALLDQVAWTALCVLVEEGNYGAGS